MIANFGAMQTKTVKLYPKMFKSFFFLICTWQFLIIMSQYLYYTWLFHLYQSPNFFYSSASFFIHIFRRSFIFFFLIYFLMDNFSTFSQFFESVLFLYWLLHDISTFILPKPIFPLTKKSLQKQNECVLGKTFKKNAYNWKKSMYFSKT